MTTLTPEPMTKERLESLKLNTFVERDGEWPPQLNTLVPLDAALAYGAAERTDALEDFRDLPRLRST